MGGWMGGRDGFGGEEVVGQRGAEERAGGSKQTLARGVHMLRARNALFSWRRRCNNQQGGTTSKWEANSKLHEEHQLWQGSRRG